jgi:sugar/nucleoside kinase (ribokinase family)
MPNEREACLLAGENDLDCAISILRGLVPLLVIKRGSEGAIAFCGPQSWHVPAERAHFVDAVGAGDSFNAGFLHAWIRGWPMERALELGNRTGALSVAASGGTAAFRNKTTLLAQIAQISAVT